MLHRNVVKPAELGLTKLDEIRANMVKQAGTLAAMSTDAHDPGRMSIEKERRRSDRYPLSFQFT
jgi:hypothetical protein